MLRVVIINPSKYGVTGFVERFWRGFMPNSTVRYILSMTPASIDGVRIEVCAVDEYVHTDLGYLDLIRHPNVPTLLALVGVQSHQFQRSSPPYTGWSSPRMASLRIGSQTFSASDSAKLTPKFQCIDVSHVIG